MNDLESIGKIETRQLMAKSFWIVVGAAIIVALMIQWGRLTDPYQVEEDFRKFHYMHRFQDREALPDYVEVYGRLHEIQLGSFYLLVDRQSPGYSLLLQLASYLVSPVLFSKLLVFPLLLLAVYYLYGLVEKWHAAGTAVTVSLAFIILSLAMPTSISPIGGLQRSFVLPLLLGTIYYLDRRRDGAAAVVVFLIGVIYAPAFFIAVATYGLTALSWPQVPDWRPQPDERSLHFENAGVYG